MPFDSDNQYKQLFIEEAKEHIGNLTKCLLTLEKEPQNQDVVNTLFRSAHTLKGSSGMMGFKDFQALTHTMEDVFDGMRKGNQPANGIFSTLLECVDALSMRLENIQNGVEGEIEVSEYKNRLKDGMFCSESVASKQPFIVLSQENKPAPAALAKEALTALSTKAGVENKHSCMLDLTFSKDCSFKTIRANMVLNKVGELAQIIKTFPEQNQLDEDKLSGGFKIAVATGVDDAVLQKTAQQVLEVEQVHILPFDPKNPNSPAVSAALIHTIDFANSGCAVSEKAKIIADALSAQTVRVKFDQLDKLMNWVGELVINKIALLQVTSDVHNDGLKRITENIDRLTADLQDLVMQVRMVPVSQVFDRFPRLVRDLSLTKGKKIELVMEGRDIEIDRTVLDEIGEPLIHLLRNSIDHGIELPDDRENVNKNPEGKIRLSAQRSGDHVFIEIEDDGQGIATEKIRASAIKKGVATELELEKMSSEQLVNLIFLPGFSTAKEITDTSGRGVGMDVVKTKIASLGGTVHLETRVGQGTKIVIKLPLTLAIIQAILVSDSGQTFAIPTSQVSEIVQVRRSDVRSLGKTDAIVVRDHVIPIAHLHKLLGLSGQDEETLELLITFLGDEHHKLALAVDSVMRQQDVLIKPLNGVLKGIPGISGATILGDGQVVLVLDIAQFLDRNHKASVNLKSAA